LIDFRPAHAGWLQLGKTAGDIPLGTLPMGHS
jgi:hypothetical protein